MARRKAFTLIEVMVAIVIISTVIAALITMSGNNTHIFSNLRNTIMINQYASFFISNKQYGLTNNDVSLDKLVDDFDLDKDLRRKLKTIDINIKYTVIDQIDMGKYDNSENIDEEGTDTEEDVNSALLIEIGRTTLRTDSASTSLLRVQVNN